MKFVKTIARIRLIDELISQGRTGTPFDLSKILKISERAVYYHIKTMKALGGTIYFDKEKQSYLYKGNISFICGYKILEDN